MKKLLMVIVGVIACSGLVMANEVNKDATRIIEEASAALDKNPNDLAARVARSEAALEGKQYAMAIEDFTVLIDKAPTSLAYFKRGQAYEHEGVDDKAIDDYTRSLELDDKSLYAYFFRGGLYSRKGMYRKAIADYDATIALWADNVHFFYTRGDTYYRMADYDSAIRDWQKAMALGYDKAFLNKRIAAAREKLQ